MPGPDFASAVLIELGAPARLLGAAAVMLGIRNPLAADWVTAESAWTVVVGRAAGGLVAVSVGPAGFAGTEVAALAFAAGVLAVFAPVLSEPADDCPARNGSAGAGVFSSRFLLAIVGGFFGQHLIQIGAGFLGRIADVQERICGCSCSA